MDQTQFFRLSGNSAIEKIPCDSLHGQPIIYWSDIERLFPTVRHVKNGEVFVELLKDSNQNRIEPHCIKYHPGITLDVVLSASGGNSPATASRFNSDTASIFSEDHITERIRATNLSPRSRAFTDPSSGGSSDASRSFKTGLSFEQVVTIAQNKSTESKAEQQLVISLPSDVQLQVLASRNMHDALIQAIQDRQVQHSNEQLVACLQELNGKIIENKDLASKIVDLVSKNNELMSRNNELASRIREMASKNNELGRQKTEQMTRAIALQEALTSKQDEMSHLQDRAFNRLAALQSDVKAILTQTFQLHERPLPRLFIVLPEDSFQWNPLDPHSNKFRLYFLCECGVHTKSSRSKIPQRLHLAKHSGYGVERPNEFFREYGSYVLTILRMLKFGISAGGVSIPSLSELIETDALDQPTSSLRRLSNTITPKVNQVIDFIERFFAGESNAIQVGGNGALESADLRQLDTFLKNQDGNRALGNLYKTADSEGHVRWLCMDHYREQYPEKAAKSFRDSVEVLQGSFDENIGRVEVTLTSKSQADRFYQVLEKTGPIFELKLCLDWDASQSDFKKLRDTLLKTRVGMLELVLRYRQGPTNDILSRNQRYDPIFSIMRKQSIHTFSINGPQDFIKRSSLSSRNDNFVNLRHLDLSLYDLKNDILSLKCLVAKTPHLSSLAIQSHGGYLPQFYMAIADHQTYPITFKAENLCIPPPHRNPNQSMAAHEYMEHLLKACSEKFDTLLLTGNELDAPIVDALVKANRNGSGLKGLRLKQGGRLGEALVNNIVSFMIQSELRNIEVHTKEDEGRLHILESIPWRHLRELVVHLKQGHYETSVLRTFLDRVNSMSGTIVLEKFCFYSDVDRDTDAPLCAPQEFVLPPLLASISLETLVLDVYLPAEEIHSVLQQADFSRLKRFGLWAKGYDPRKVEYILKEIRKATQLELLELARADVTDEQVSRMKGFGVTLRNHWLLLK